MARQFVRELSEQQDVDQVFLASRKQVRSNRQGNPYLQVILADKSGTINGLMWNVSDEQARNFEGGDYVQVVGKTHVHNGELQIIAKRISRAAEAEVAEEDFLRVTDKDLAGLEQRLREILQTIADPHLRRLADAFLGDEQLMQKFRQAPAGVKNHHAYHGGLLEHVVQLSEIITRIADLYPNLNRDLLLMGALLHDAGKVDELGYDRDFVYTDEGQLVGHIVMAVGMLDGKVAAIEEQSGETFPADLKLHLKHIIVSHHGSQDFGSPTVPMTLEAIALHHLDNLDAKIHQFETAVNDDVNVDTSWTQYHPSLGRKIYKRRPEGETD